jgi:hypothetical protein
MLEVGAHHGGRRWSQVCIGSDPAIEPGALWGPERT